MDTDQAGSITITRSQRRFASWMTDVLVYIVVLNLFVEHHEAIIIESFTISILTAILLKLMLDAIGSVEQRVHGFFEQREGPFFKTLGYILLFAILFLGKLLILEVVNIVFGDRVELGHFFDVVLLIIAMIAARELMAWIYRRLGDQETSAQA
jgi:hypothetical protein